MAKYGFLDTLEEALDQHLTYDFAIDWDKKNHAVEVIVHLEVQNQSAVETIDEDGEASDGDILFEDSILFYHQTKSQVDPSDYLTTIAFDPKKGFSREFLDYFADFLQLTLDKGLDDLLDFLADPEAEEFALDWDNEAFEKGRAELVETTYFAYPRY